MAVPTLVRTKPIDQSIEDTQDETNGLRRTLGPVDLVVFGVGVIIGTGIFVLTGQAAGTLAGPAIDLERAYRTPAVPLVPILAVLTSLWLMLNLPAQTWERFGIWMVAGLVVYFAYGRRRSRVD